MESSRSGSQFNKKSGWILCPDMPAVGNTALTQINLLLSEYTNVRERAQTSRKWLLGDQVINEEADE